MLRYFCVKIRHLLHILYRLPLEGCAVISDAAYSEDYVEYIIEYNGDREALMDLYQGGILPEAMCVVVDSAGLPHLRKLRGKGGTKTVEELQELKAYAKTPMIIKGIMTADELAAESAKSIRGGSIFGIVAGIVLAVIGFGMIVIRRQ